MENTKQTARKQSSQASSNNIKIKHNIDDQVSNKSSKSIKNSQNKSIKNSTKKIQNNSHQQNKDIISVEIQLMFATLLDTQSVQSAINQFRIFMQSKYNQKDYAISLPCIYSLIKQYESIFGRAYKDEIRYYMIGTLWDQGIIKVGNAQDWQAQVQQQLSVQKQKQEQNQIGYIDAARDEAIKSRVEVITGHNAKNSNKKLTKYDVNGLNSEIIKVFQCIQRQYYREYLTLQRITQQISNHSNENQQQSLNQNSQKILSKQIGNKFNDLDMEKVGSIPVTRFIQKFKLSFDQKQIKNCQYLMFMIRKLSNNLHMYDRYSNTVSNPVSHSDDPLNIRLYIENIMELFNRVDDKNFNKLNHISVTYSAISSLLSKYQNIKNAAYKKSLNSQKSGLKQRNKKVQLVSQLEHIRQAANIIVSQSKINGELAHLKGNQNTQYAFYGNQLNQQDNQPTFRTKPRYMQDQLELEQTALKEKHKLQIGPLRNYRIQDLLSKQKAFMQKQGHFNRDNLLPVYSSLPEDSKYKQKLKQKFQNHSPYVAQFKIYPEPSAYQYSTNQKFANPSPSSLNFETLNKIYESQAYSAISEHNYNKLLRQRIMNEMQIVELQRISNKLKYYDIIFK